MQACRMGGRKETVLAFRVYQRIPASTEVIDRIEQLV